MESIRKIEMWVKADEAQNKIRELALEGYAISQHVEKRNGVDGIEIRAIKLPQRVDREIVD